MSSTPRVVGNPRLTKLLVDSGAFAADRFFVVDVGASGGIDSYWHQFQGQLTAVGFDPLIAEVERLNAEAPPGVTYVDAWVTSPSPRQNEDVPSTDFFPRTSAVLATEIATLDYAREYNNAGVDIEFAADRIVLDDYFEVDVADSIDFLKIDTDGHDFDVLVGCDRILSSGRVLGLAVELQFHGPVSAKANLFSNVDGLLRSKGFGLFDLEVYRYSRSALPAQFLYDIPAQTTTGQVSWGESVYFRDLGHPDYEKMWGFEPTTEDVLKLMCLFEIFGMPDCSAELILKYGERVCTESERARFLDVLAAEQSGREVTYSELQRDFADNSSRRIWQTAKVTSAPGPPRRRGILNRRG